MSMLLSIFVLPSPSPLCPQACSLCLRLYFFPVNRFISTVFLDSIYMHGYMIFIFFFLKKGALKAQETFFFLPLR